MIYTIADTHLSLTTEKPMDIFGPRWENHAEKLKENWLAAVQPDDTVVLPGDISWGISLEEAAEDLKFLDRLPGKKLIGKGNHDYWWTTVNKMSAFFAENGITSLSFLYNNAYLAENKILCGTRGWMSEFGIKAEDERIIRREAARLELSLAEGEKLKKNAPEAEMLVFLHYPVVFGDFINDEMLDVLYRHGVTDVYYGHLHNVRESQLDKQYLGIRFHLIAADYLNFKPLALLTETAD
ncbi:MAG: metallophosphoesterase [Eubacteriales bacterium]